MNYDLIVDGGWDYAIVRNFPYSTSTTDGGVKGRLSGVQSGLDGYVQWISYEDRLWTSTDIPVI